MTGHSNSEFDILVGKYLAGEASPEEAIAIEEWLSIPGNREQFREMMKVWGSIPGTKNHSTPDIKHEWLQWQQKPHEDRHRSILRADFKRYWIAASVLIIIVSAIVVMLLTRSSKLEDNQQLVIRSSINNVLIDTLPDASVAIINQNSTVSYSHDFNLRERNLDLRGECFFNVTPSTEKPFVIHVEDLRIKVVGTSFNVKTIPGSESIEVQVASGVVQLIGPDDDTTLVQGQTGIYNKSTRNFIVRDSVNTNSISYATHQFEFTDNTLQEVVGYLENAFGVTIKGEKQMLSTCRLTAHFKNQSLDYILDVIAATLNITYKKEGKTIHFIGKGCL